MEPAPAPAPAPGPATTVEGALDALRHRGERVTTARRAVVSVLLAGDGDLSAEEVAAAVQRHEPGVHLSTVYRTLEVLEEAGVVSHVHLGHGRALYQLTDDPHQHAECDLCGQVIELEPDVLEAVAARLRAEHDFELDTRHFPLLGRCASCRAVSGGAPHRHGRR
jgi:Fur family ferric uptake transcriptional regulator